MIGTDVVKLSNISLYKIQ